MTIERMIEFLTIQGIPAQYEDPIENKVYTMDVEKMKTRYFELLKEVSAPYVISEEPTGNTEIDE